MAHSENLVFKPYDPAQSTFLPPNLGQLIPATHQVRFISGVIDRLNIDELLAGYKGGGTSAYHPRMMLKILIYGYVQRIYTCRDLAKASRENIHFMWLTGGQQPNFRTINLFRKSRLRGTLKELYTQVMELLVEQKLVDLNDYFLDGSIVQANARKHSAVWAKNTERWEASVREQIGELFEQIQKIADVEDQEYGDGDLRETGHASQWDSEQVDEAARKLNETLSAQKDTPGRSKATRILSKLVKEKLPRLKGYEQQKRLLGRRKSYSKTDLDATFMKGKDQPVFSRDLRPAYNIQLGTQNQFILGYGVHQSPSDKSHLREHIDGLFFRPGSVIADGGYGSLANYEWLNEKGIRAQVKYPGYDRKPSAYSPEQMVYDEKEDTYRCPQGRTLHYDSERLYRYGDGQLTPVHRYRCESCRDCPVKSECHRGEGDRTMTVNPMLMVWRRWVDRQLSTPRGEWLKKRRGAEVESVLGQLKQNDGLTRFTMRGLGMVELELGLKAMAHNLRRLHAVVAGKTQPTWAFES